MKPIVVNLRTLGQSQITGVERYTQEITRRLPELRKIRTGKLEGMKGHIWEQWMLPNQLRGELLWSPANTGPLIVRKQVVTIHDASVLDQPAWFETKFAAWYRWLLPRLIQRVATILTVSQFSKERLLSHTPIDPERVKVVPLAADNRFEPSSMLQISLVKKKYLLPPNYVLVVGSLEPRKNLSRLFKAWTILANRYEDVELVVVGGKGKAFKGIGFEQLPSRVTLLGRIDDEDLPTLYSGAIAFVYPSLYEGFGLPPLEAMACGVPVLTSITTSIPEVVGNAAIKVNPLDTEAIAEGLDGLLSSSELRKHLRSLGLERIKHFSWDKAAKQTWQVLQEAAQD